jgi:hypothetical protein
MSSRRLLLCWLGRQTAPIRPARPAAVRILLADTAMLIIVGRTGEEAALGRTRAGRTARTRTSMHRTARWIASAPSGTCAADPEVPKVRARGASEQLEEAKAANAHRKEKKDQT